MLTAGFAGGAVGLGGCLGDSNDESGLPAPDPDEWPDLTGREVHVLTSESSVPYQQYWTDLSAAFETATNASVTVEYGGIGISYRERLSKLLAAGSPPEVSHLGMNDAASYGTAGQLADHTEIVEHWERRWSETPDGMRIALGNGDVYLPMLSNPHTLWYREDVIDAPPETWSEELDRAAAVDEGRGGTRATAIPLSSGFAGQNKFLSYGWSNGAQVCASAGDDVEVVMDSTFLDDWVEVCEHYEQLYEYCDPGTDTGTGEYIQAVGSGFAYWNQYVGARTKLAAEGTPVGGDIAPAHPPFRTSRRLYGNVQGKAVFADADVEAGMSFLRFMARPEYLVPFYFADPIHNAPVHETIRAHDLFQRRLEKLPEYWDIPEHLNFAWIENGVDMANEFGGVNPHAGDMLNSFELFGVTYDVLVNEHPPREAIENRADALRKLIRDSHR